MSWLKCCRKGLLGGWGDKGDEMDEMDGELD